jgi:intracellular multiplication protein IcmO
MIPREIIGPQEHLERTGAQSLRDVRPFATRLWERLMSEFSGILLAGSAALMWLEPASVDVIVPTALGYTGLVLTRRVKGPLRLPRSAGVKDWNYPVPGTRRPRQAAGTIFLGNDCLTGQELWISSEDARQHATIPGTTGAGKTTAILSFLANALTHASGFVLVDGKADSKLFGEVMALARRFGREDDVLHLNLIVASGSKASNTFNPLAVGNADAIREMVVSQLGEQAAHDSNGVFRSRAVALMGAIAPVLTWMRDHKGVPIDIEKIRDALELRVIWKLAVKRVFELRDPKTGAIADIPVETMPEDIIYPLQAYLGEIPGYDTALDYNQQKSDEPSKQHGFARFYFTATFTQLAVSLGHIFKVEQGDIDMRDVVMNRRILVVSLPALENSSDTLAGLGKIVVASLRGMMAQMLNTPLDKLGPSAPFQVVLDELAYYATSDLDRMLAQGRSLNFMFWLSFQEVSGIWARLGEKMQTLLGNANLTIAMRQQEASRTREWIEQTAGSTYVTQATSYESGEGGGYHEAEHAEVRQVARVDWNDLQRLIEGEAIILFGGRRIYARLFYAGVDTSGPVRLNRPLRLTPPKPREIAAESQRIEAIATALKTGKVALSAPEPASPTLRAMVAQMSATTAPGGANEAAIASAIAAAGENPLVAPLAVIRDAGIPTTPFTPMLEQAVDRDPEEQAPPAPVAPSHPGDPGLYAALTRLEAAAGASPAAARQNALAVLDARDKATTLMIRRPKPMTPTEMRERIDGLIRLLAASGPDEEAPILDEIL